MITALDLNADLGEHDDIPPASDLDLLSVITSANVACGGHAGNVRSMRSTAEACLARNVRIGAHPSYPDREGFGRRAVEMSPAAIRATVQEQIAALRDIAHAAGARLAHVKPHGALYNVAWREPVVAAAIVAAIVDVDPSLLLFAPAGSELTRAAASRGVRTVAEGFLDRAYEPDGTLTPRSMPGAVIDDAERVCERAVTWVRTGRVQARAGDALELPIQTLCVHGDTPGAALLAVRTRRALEAAGVTIAAP